MRKFFSLFIIALSMVVSFSATAQLKDPVKWSASSKKVATDYEVTLIATLPRPWHIYSQYSDNGGSGATTFKFAKNPLVTFDGGVKEVGKLKEVYDKYLDTKLKYFGDRVEFVQNVKVKGSIKTNVSVTVEYVTCDDSHCLPPTKKTFSVSL